jgi:4'-phosphopantetheinyl transferase
LREEGSKLPAWDQIGSSWKRRISGLISFKGTNIGTTGTMTCESEAWKSAPVGLALSPDRIDIWRVCLDPGELPPHDLILSRDEAARASRLHFEHDRRRFVNCRTALRIILGRYLDTHPAEVRFQYEKNGKPELASSQNSCDLRFNVSHSGEWALIAITSGRALGVDIEKVRPMSNHLEIAGRFFSARELEEILAVSEPRRQDAFFACWTRKEAFLKAIGAGLSYPLSKFSVSVDPDEPAGLGQVGDGIQTDSRWHLADLRPAEGYRGALAWEGVCCRLDHWTFDPP